MSIRAKIKQEWNYTEGPGQDVELGHDGTNYFILKWPTANPPTITEIEAVQLPVDYELVQLRNAAKAALDNSKAESALLRAALLVIVGEFNTHSAKTNAILTAIDNATNLANLKAAIAAIPDLPQRTGNQLRIAANNKLDAGDGDT